MSTSDCACSSARSVGVTATIGSSARLADAEHFSGCGNVARVARTFAGGTSGFTRDLHLAAPAEMHECQAYDSGVADLDGDGRFELIASYAGDAAGALAFPCPNAGGFAGWRIESTGAADTAARSPSR